MTDYRASSASAKNEDHRRLQAHGRSSRLQRGVTPNELFRSKDASLEIAIATASETAVDLIDAVRDYWVVLRDMGLADGNPVKVIADATDVGSVLWLFRWKDAASRSEALASDECVRAMARIEAAAESIERIPFANEIYQGFEYRRFPQRGGIELLRGKCTCTVHLDDFNVDFELDGQNGFVIMHRGPRFVQDDVHIMPVTINQHGADAPNPLANVAELRDAPRDVMAAPFRVEQNTDLPQFGIIRALEPEWGAPRNPDSESW